MPIRSSSPSPRTRLRRAVRLAACLAPLAAVAAGPASASAATLAASPTSLAFGSQLVTAGPTAPKTTTFTNSSAAGGGDVVFNSVVIDNRTEFPRGTAAANECADRQTLTPGQSCVITVTFDPSGVGNRAGTLTVDSNASITPTTVSLSGRGIELTNSPSALDFGSQDVSAGPTYFLDSTVTNTGPDQVMLNNVSIFNNDGQFNSNNDGQFYLDFGFNGDGQTCRNSLTLASNTSCRIRVRFDPSSIGSKSGTVSVTTNDGQSLTVGLQGFGTRSFLSPDPGSLAFGARDVDAGPTAVLESRVTNTGSETLYLNGVTLGGDTTEFERLTGLTSDCSANQTLFQGNSCVVRVRFDPTSTGGKSALVSVFSDRASTTVTLTGSGARSGLSAAPATLGFGTRQLGTGPSSEQQGTVTNTGTQAVNLDRVTFDGDSSQFELLRGQSADCAAGTVLAVGGTCTVRVRFAPTSEGTKSAALRVGAGAVQTSFALTGAASAAATPPASSPPAASPPASPNPPAQPPEALIKNGTWSLIQRAEVQVTLSSRGILVATGYVAACPSGGPACTGRVTLAIRRRSAAGKVQSIFLHAKVASRTISPGAEQRLTFRLSRGGARRLRAAGVLTAKLRGSIRTGSGPVVVKTESVEIVMPSSAR